MAAAKHNAIHNIDQATAKLVTSSPLGFSPASTAKPVLIKSGTLLLRSRWATVTGVWKSYRFCLFGGRDGAYLECFHVKSGNRVSENDLASFNKISSGSLHFQTNSIQEHDFSDASNKNWKDTNHVPSLEAAGRLGTRRGNTDKKSKTHRERSGTALSSSSNHMSQSFESMLRAQERRQARSDTISVATTTSPMRSKPTHSRTISAEGNIGNRYLTSQPDVEKKIETKRLVFKFLISRVFQPRRYASKRHAYVFQVYSAKLDETIQKRHARQQRSALRRQSAEMQRHKGRKGWNFSNRFKRGKSLILAASTYEICEEWIMAISSINALNQHSALGLRHPQLSRLPDTAPAALISDNKSIVRHVLQLHKSDGRNGSPVLDLSCALDYLYRFHANALVYDVVCYCMIQRLNNGIITPADLLFYVSQIVIILRLKVASSSNTSVLLETLLFSCLVLTADNPSEQANAALKIYWALISELPRIPADYYPLRASDLDGAQRLTASGISVSYGKQEWGLSNPQDFHSSATIRKRTSKGMNPDPMHVNGMDPIRPKDVYIYRLLLVLEYYMYRRKIEVKKEYKKSYQRLRRGYERKSSMKVVSKQHGKGKNIGEDRSTDSLSSIEVQGKDAGPRREGFLNSPKAANDKSDQVEEPPGWWMAPTVLRIGEAFQAVFATPQRTRPRSRLFVAFFKVPSDTMTLAPTHVRGRTLLDLQWAISSRPIRSIGGKQHQGGVNDFSWPANKIPTNEETQKPVSWVAVRLVHAHFLRYTGSKGLASTFGLRMLKDYTDVEVRSDIGLHTLTDRKSSLRPYFMTFENCCSMHKVLPQEIALAIEEMKSKCIEPGILMYLPTLASATGLASSRFANSNLDGASAAVPQLSLTELRLVRKFIVRNRRSEGYTDLFAANRRFVAALIRISEALKPLSPEDRKVSLRNALARLQQQHVCLINRDDSKIVNRVKSVNIIAQNKGKQLVKQFSHRRLLKSNANERSSQGGDSDEQPIHLLFDVFFANPMRNRKKELQTDDGGAYHENIVNRDSVSHKIVRLLPEESVVFNTRERAPFLLCMETIRTSGLKSSQATGWQSSPSHSNTDTPLSSHIHNSVAQDNSLKETTLHPRKNSLDQYITAGNDDEAQQQQFRSSVVKKEKNKNNSMQIDNADPGPSRNPGPSRVLSKMNQVFTQSMSELPLTPKSLYFDRVNSKLSKRASYSCQGWMYRSAIKRVVNMRVQPRMTWQRHFFRLHPRTRTLSFYGKMGIIARAKGVLYLHPDSTVQRVTPEDIHHNYRLHALKVICRNTDDRKICIHMATSKESTLLRWKRELTTAIEGYESKQKHKDPCTERLKLTKAKNAAAAHKAQAFTIQNGLPLEWLSQNLKPSTLSRDAFETLCSVSQSHDPLLQYTATWSKDQQPLVLCFTKDIDLASGICIRCGDILAAVGHEIVMGYSEDQIMTFLQSCAVPYSGNMSALFSHADSKKSGAMLGMAVENVTYLRSDILNCSAPLVEGWDSDSSVDNDNFEEDFSQNYSGDGQDELVRKTVDDDADNDFGHDSSLETSAAYAFRLARAASIKGTYVLSTHSHSEYAIKLSASKTEEFESPEDPLTEFRAQDRTSRPISPRLSQFTSQLLRQDSFMPLSGQDHRITGNIQNLPATVATQFGELWQQKSRRVAMQSNLSTQEGWSLRSVVIKSFDDLRQECFVLQMAAICEQVWADDNGLPLRLHAYSIVSTGAGSGFIETISNAKSLDQIKRGIRPDGTLRMFFEQSYGFLSTDFKNAQIRFAESLAASCIFTYLMLVKDRHNGNIMLRSDGMLVHIDYGFILGQAPGGRFSLERVPFKLTAEMVAVIDGPNSMLWAYFEGLVVSGFLALRQAQPRLESMLAIATETDFPCMVGINKDDMIKAFRQRLMVDCDSTEFVENVRRLLCKSYDSAWSRYYDEFQRVSNGIAP